jgi:hypothetical protein
MVRQELENSQTRAHKKSPTTIHGLGFTVGIPKTLGLWAGSINCNLPQEITEQLCYEYNPQLVQRRPKWKRGCMSSCSSMHMSPFNKNIFHFRTQAMLSKPRSKGFVSAYGDGLLAYKTIGWSRNGELSAILENDLTFERMVATLSMIKEEFVRRDVTSEQTAISRPTTFQLRLLNDGLLKLPPHTLLKRVENRLELKILSSMDSVAPQEFEQNFQSPHHTLGSASWPRSNTPWA